MVLTCPTLGMFQSLPSLSSSFEQGIQLFVLYKLNKAFCKLHPHYRIEAAPLLIDPRYLLASPFGVMTSI